MIELLEKELKQLEKATRCPNTPEKYKKQATKKYIKLTKELNKIYSVYNKVYTMEKKIAKEFEIEIYE